MADKVEQATASMIRNLEEKTGKSLDQWVGIARGLGGLKHGALVAVLKEKHGLGHGYANLVAHSATGAVGAGAPAGDDLLAAQYGGDKAALRPIYDRLAAQIRAFGKDVEISPKKGYVSLRRSKQFAIVQPSTKSRIDIGINLKGAAPAGRLEASGSFNAMVTHRVRIESPKEIDAELLAWLRRAYDSA
jgi:hypothetical protein